ncbi:MAG: hypothetical protein V3T17_08655 [Pseudomonadales bacterium]
MTIKTQPSKPTPRNEQFRKDMVASWKSSGLSQSAFCRREGLAVESFNKWKVEIMGKESPETKPKEQRSIFIPVEVEPNPVDHPREQGTIEVTLANKLVIKIPLDIPPHQAVPLIEALSGVRC